MNGSRYRVWVLILLLCLTTKTAATSPQTAGSGSTDVARDSFTFAMTTMRDGKYDQALKQFDDIRAKFPNTRYAADALLQVALYHFLIAKDMEKASSAVETLTKNYFDPSYEAAPEAYILKGRIVLAQSRTQRAIDDALTAFRNVPGVYGGASGAANSVPQAMYFEGNTLRITGQTDAALAVFLRLASGYPESPWASRARLGAAQCLSARGDRVRAMEELQRVSLRFPGTPEARTATAWNTMLYRLAVRGAVPYRYTAKTLPAAPGKLKDVGAMVIDSQDVLYVMRPNGVDLYSSEGTYRKTIAAQEPTGLFLDAGRLVVVQKGRLAPDGADPIALALPRSDNPVPRPLEDIEAAAIWSTGEYLVSERGAKAILKFSSKKSLGSLGTLQSGADRIVVNALDEAAILNSDERTVTFLDRDGKVVRRIQPRGTSPAYELRKPTDIAFDPLGNLFVLDRTAVYVFGPDVKLLSVIAIAEKQPGALRDARAFAMDSSGRLFIYDNKDERIQIYQ